MKNKTIFYLSWIFLLILLSCNTAETAGEKITFLTGIKGASDAETKEHFINSKGFEITLKKAYASLGPVYFYSKKPLSSIEKCPAHAQADKGRILGEIPKQYAVDLLSSTLLETGRTNGETGIIKMSELHIHPPKYSQLKIGSNDSEYSILGEDSVLVEGIAKKDEKTYLFVVNVTIPDEGTMRIVENITADLEINLESGGNYQIILSVLLDKWFINVDFSTLENETDGIFRFSENSDSQAYTAFLLALKSQYSYTIIGREK